MPHSYIPYARQCIDASDKEAVAAALDEDLITRGPPVQAFEEAFARMCGASYAVAFCNGTAALNAAYFAADLKPYDVVLSTPNSFIATVAAPIRMEARLQFVDIDPQTGSLDLDLLKSKLRTPMSRGRPFIVPVHFGGIAMDMAALQRLQSNPATVVIEDAAHAVGSSYPSGEKVGSCAYSDMTMFSFHPAKTLTTGEGGMVTTNNEHYYRNLLHFRDNGINRTPQPGYYEVQSITGNFHLTSFQGALGLSQLSRLDDFAKKRRQLIKMYRSYLAKHPEIKLFTDQFDSSTAFHLMVIQIDFESLGKTRIDVMNQLASDGIGTQVHYIPLYRHPVLTGDALENYPAMENYYAKALTLPLYYDLNKEDVTRICKAVMNRLGLKP